MCVARQGRLTFRTTEINNMEDPEYPPRILAEDHEHTHTNDALWIYHAIVCETKVRSQSEMWIYENCRNERERSKADIDATVRSCVALVRPMFCGDACGYSM
jgi:hypothetical protein